MPFQNTNGKTHGKMAKLIPVAHAQHRLKQSPKTTNFTIVKIYIGLYFQVEMSVYWERMAYYRK